MANAEKPLEGYSQNFQARDTQTSNQNTYPFLTWGWDSDYQTAGQRGGLHPKMASSLNAFAKELKELGLMDKLHIINAVRTYEQQKQLYDASDQPGVMVAHPDTGYHVVDGNRRLFGKAVDVDRSKFNDIDYVLQNSHGTSLDKLMAKYGLYRPMDYEPWHIQHKDVDEEFRTGVPTAPAQVPMPTRGGVSMQEPTYKAPVYDPIDPAVLETYKTLRGKFKDPSKALVEEYYRMLPMQMGAYSGIHDAEREKEILGRYKEALAVNQEGIKADATQENQQLALQIQSKILDELNNSKKILSPLSISTLSQMGKQAGLDALPKEAWEGTPTTQQAVQNYATDTSRYNTEQTNQTHQYTAGLSYNAAMAGVAAQYASIQQRDRELAVKIAEGERLKEIASAQGQNIPRELIETGLKNATEVYKAALQAGDKLGMERALKDQAVWMEALPPKFRDGFRIAHGIGVQPGGPGAGAIVPASNPMVKINQEEAKIDAQFEQGEIDENTWRNKKQGIKVEKENHWKKESEKRNRQRTISWETDPRNHPGISPIEIFP